MNIREYIESGVIELYVMNALTAPEAAEVAAMARQYPEVQVEIDEAERAMQAYAQAHSIEPRPELKDEILNKIKGDTGVDSPTETPKQIEKAPSLPTASGQVSILSYLPWGIAALLGISTLLLYNNYRTLKADKEKCEQEQNTQLLKNQKAIADVEFKLNILRDNKTIPVRLSDPNRKKPFEAIVFWNPKQKVTILSIGSLPKPEKGQQYQLWAIGASKPIDAGVFDSNIGEIQIMKTNENVKTFAITLEPQGGSKEPTLENLLILGGL
jgi:Anti-sigma-K factor rskA